MRRALIGIAVGAAAAVLARGLVWERGHGSWRSGIVGDADSFQVETVEVQYGPLYAELVWGRWR